MRDREATDRALESYREQALSYHLLEHERECEEEEHDERYYEAFFDFEEEEEQ